MIPTPILTAYKGTETRQSNFARLIPFASFAGGVVAFVLVAILS